VNATAPFGGDVLIADTSVWLRADQFPDPLKDEWAAALANDQIATTPFIVFELFYRARNNQEKFERWRAAMDHIRRLVVPDGSVWAFAHEAYVELIEASQFGNMPLTDILNAASSAQTRFPVLHVDKDYARLAQLDCLDFEERRLQLP
jgi:predicted nucleic acid-binding protein